MGGGRGDEPLPRAHQTQARWYVGSGRHAPLSDTREERALQRHFRGENRAGFGRYLDPVEIRGEFGGDPGWIGPWIRGLTSAHTDAAQACTGTCAWSSCTKCCWRTRDATCPSQRSGTISGSCTTSRPSKSSYVDDPPGTRTRRAGRSGRDGRGDGRLTAMLADAWRPLGGRGRRPAAGRAEL